MDAPRLTWIKVLLPLLVMTGLNILPFERESGELLSRAAVAELDDQPHLAALYLHRALERQPWRTSLWERAALDLLDAGNDGEAVSDLERAREAGVLSLRGQVELALAYERADRYREAAQAWDEIALRQPGVEVFSHAASNWRRAGEVNLSIRALRSWQALDPTNAAVAYNLAVLLAAVSPADSLAQLDDAARYDGQYAAAQESLRRTLALSDLAADSGYQLALVGRWLANQGEWDLAEGVLARAVVDSPGYAEAWALLGEAREQLGRDGLADLQKALQLNPGSVLTRALMALYWGRQGSWEEAIGHMQAAAKLEPQRAIWRTELGSLYAQSGDLIQAQSELEAAVRLEPQSVAAWQALAGFSLQYGVDEEGLGLQAAEKALELDDSNPVTYDLLGSLYAAVDKPAEGEDALLRALELNPNYAEAHLHLGSFYLQEGKTGQAFTHLEKAAQLGGDGVTGTLARRLLERYFNIRTGGGGQP